MILKLLTFVAMVFMDPVLGTDIELKPSQQNVWGCLVSARSKPFTLSPGEVVVLEIDRRTCQVPQLDDSTWILSVGVLSSPQSSELDRRPLQKSDEITVALMDPEKSTETQYSASNGCKKNDKIVLNPFPREQRLLLRILNKGKSNRTLVLDNPQYPKAGGVSEIFCKS